MLDNLERLRNDAQLQQLLSHYARLGEANPEAWQIRLAHMESAGRVDLVKLHGELIAFDFIQQNSGQMPCCYRLSRAGQKAFRDMADVTDEPGTVERLNQAA